MNYSIRELKRDENKILDTFLYEAIFIPEGVPAPSKDIINKPDLQVYVKDFGENKGDLCLVAQVADEIVGAVWVRIMNDYGHIDNETPSFARAYRMYLIWKIYAQPWMLRSTSCFLVKNFRRRNILQKQRTICFIFCRKITRPKSKTECLCSWAAFYWSWAWLDFFRYRDPI